MAVDQKKKVDRDMFTNEEGQSESCLWRKKRRRPPLESTLLPPQSDDVLKLDEAWTFVGAKQNPCWIWVALCRRTRQIQGKLLAIGLEEEPKMIANSYTAILQNRTEFIKA